MSSYSWQLFLLDLWPGGETEFPSPPRSEQTNEADALFIIEKEKPGTKAEALLKNTEMFQMQKKGIMFHPACQPKTHAKCNIRYMLVVIWIDDDIRLHF